MTIKQNILYVAGKSIVLDTLGDCIYFPIWWYSAGLKYRVQRFASSVSDMADHLALRLLLLNIFKPMFAQYDRTGRIISFFMRIVILIGRSIYFFIFLILQLLIVVLWIALPILVFARIAEVYFMSYVAG